MEGGGCCRVSASLLSRQRYLLTRTSPSLSFVIKLETFNFNLSLTFSTTTHHARTHTPYTKSSFVPDAHTMH